MSNFTMFCIFLFLFIDTLFGLMQIDFIIDMDSRWSRFWHGALFIILYAVLVFLLFAGIFFAVKSAGDAFGSLANLLSNW